MKDLSLKDRTGLPNERIFNKVQDFCWDPVLSKYITFPRVLDYVECFVGPNIRACHSMLINKPPDTGTRTSRHPLHQDLHYFPFRQGKLEGGRSFILEFMFVIYFVILKQRYPQTVDF